MVVPQRVRARGGGWRPAERRWQPRDACGGPWNSRARRATTTTTTRPRRARDARLQRELEPEQRRERDREPERGRAWQARAHDAPAVRAAEARRGREPRGEAAGRVAESERDGEPDPVRREERVVRAAEQQAAEGGVKSSRGTPSSRGVRGRGAREGRARGARARGARARSARARSMRSVCGAVTHSRIEERALCAVQVTHSLGSRWRRHPTIETRFPARAPRGTTSTADAARGEKCAAALGLVSRPRARGGARGVSRQTRATGTRRGAAVRAIDTRVPRELRADGRDDKPREWVVAAAARERRGDARRAEARDELDAAAAAAAGSASTI